MQTKQFSQLPSSSGPIDADGSEALRPPAIQRVSLLESRRDALLPLQAAAKVIFVRANGLLAYQNATGFNRRSTDRTHKKEVL